MKNAALIIALESDMRICFNRPIIPVYATIIGIAELFQLFFKYVF